NQSGAVIALVSTALTRRDKIGPAIPITFPPRGLKYPAIPFSHRGLVLFSHTGSKPFIIFFLRYHPLPSFPARSFGDQQSSNEPA
ncbi:uncharacterized protein BO97DRAFT_476394, partial [Aspergillus homomorphus CBS 101889]